MTRSWKREYMCDDCPFANAGPGFQLRLSLAKGRWREITEGLQRGQVFLCHKTTIDQEEGDDDGGEEPASYPHGQICAGARQYQRELGIVSDCEQVLTRLAAMKKQKGTTPPTKEGSDECQHDGAGGRRVGDLDGGDKCANRDDDAR